MLQARLREIQQEDLEKVFQWRNQEFIRQVMFNSDIIEWEQHLNWYSSLKNNKFKKTKIFSINDIDFGILNVSEIDEFSSTCSWGFYIGEKSAPKGTGLFLGYLSLEYIFNALMIRKVCAEVIESNVISRNFHEKLGFKLDGILRNHIKKESKYENVYVYSLFACEWEERLTQIKKEIEVRFR